MKRGLLALVLAGLTTACSSALTPFPTAPRPLDAGANDPGARVAICYNAFKTSAEQLQKLAEQECLGGTIAERYDTDYRLDDCPILTPARATFLCRAKPK
ncbi:MAG TPA: hypothetical protein VME41_07795 [Stellaceae bacterium]|nr:hypothetical protein [Stellaceae bacterium]